MLGHITAEHALDIIHDVTAGAMVEAKARSGVVERRGYRLAPSGDLNEVAREPLRAALEEALATSSGVSVIVDLTKVNSIATPTIFDLLRFVGSAGRRRVTFVIVRDSNVAATFQYLGLLNVLNIEFDARRDL